MNWTNINCIQITLHDVVDTANQGGTKKRVTETVEYFARVAIFRMRAHNANVMNFLISISTILFKHIFHVNGMLLAVLACTGAPPFRTYLFLFPPEGCFVRCFFGVNLLKTYF